jgi:oligoribonuclease NrnB/cAMP/cGMP phosphodiesterase (DHH superfamily)
MRIVTHTDFDGVCCAALFLRKFGSNIEIIYLSVNEAKEYSNSSATVDYTCDLPKVGSSVNIDHHKSNFEDLQSTNRLTDTDWVDPNAASATDLVYNFFKFNNDPIAEEIRELGHLADIAQLPDEYKPLDVVLSMNNDNQEFLRQISEKLAIHGHSILQTPWLEENHALFEKTFKLTHHKINSFLKKNPNLPRVLILDVREKLPGKLAKEIFPPVFKKDVAVIALIYSKSKEPIRVSFRVNKSLQNLYDVARVAKVFGGGGHKMAAACSPSLSSIPSELETELRKIMKSGDTISYLKM